MFLLAAKCCMMFAMESIWPAHVHEFENLLVCFKSLIHWYLLLSVRTQSVGILSYTSLRQIGCDDVIVPVVSLLLPFFYVRKYSFLLFCYLYNRLTAFWASWNVLKDFALLQVDYKFDPVTGEYGMLACYSQKKFTSNLSLLLKWSPYSTEGELLKQVKKQPISSS